MANGSGGLTLNQKLAAAALVLGIGALFATTTRGPKLVVHRAELARAVERGEDHVTATALAAAIVEGKSDVRIVDLRDAAAYASYHLPGAENVPLAGLAAAALPRNEKLVLYADDAAHAAQAWTLLVADGYRSVTTLAGGLEAWRNEVLYPVAPANPSPDEAVRFERAASVARYFGGAPRLATASAPAGQPAALPAAAPAPVPAPAPALAPPMPAAPPVAAPFAGPKPAPKKKEGC